MAPKENLCALDVLFDESIAREKENKKTMYLALPLSAM